MPEAEFTSYYGRAVVKPAPWGPDIPAYVFLGGLAGGSSLLAAGADLTGRPALRAASRWAALGALGGSFVALVHDLGRPGRFHHMLRVAKPTSPMSVGTWVLATYGPLAGVAAVSELAPRLPGPLRRRLPGVGRTTGIAAGALGPVVATYTGVLLAATATPVWREAGRDLPWLFAGSSASAAGGLGLVAAPLRESAPARRLAVGGAAADLAAAALMERGLGPVARPLREGVAGRLMTAARGLTAGGALLAVVGRRSRLLSAVAGLGLMAGSACLRFGVFEGGQASAREPGYTVAPQRERIARGEGRPDRRHQAASGA